MSNLEHVQAIPLFTAEDSSAFKYFTERHEELDALTGTDLLIAMPQTVKEGDSKDVYSAVGDKRYPGLKLTDLPCLWVETVEDKQSFAVPLPSDEHRIVKLMRHLTQAAKDAKTASEFRKNAGKGYGIVDEKPFYLRVFVTSILLVLVAGVGVYFALPVIHQYDARLFVYGFYVVLGILAAVACFGVLRSSGKLSGEQFGSRWELGGAAAFCAVVVGGGLWYESQRPPGEFGFSVYFHENDNPNAVISADGSLTLYLDERKVVNVNRGYADVQRIPQRYNGKKVGYQLEIKGYSPSDPKSAELELRPYGEPIKIGVIPISRP